MRSIRTSGVAAIAVLAIAAMISTPGQQALAQTASSAAPYTKTRPVFVVSSRGDYHVAKVREAVAFWNRELAAMGVSFRLGSVSQVASRSGGSYSLDSERRPNSIVVMFPGSASVSHAYRGRDGTNDALAIVNRDDTLVVIHELGHLIGLRHNTVQGSLMHAGMPQSRRLTAEDKARILALYSRQAAR